MIIRPGQDAIFLYNGVTEGVFEKEGNYDIESDIIPFLSTLKGFKFGFNSGIRAEVIFINTKEFTMKWGTKQAVNLPTEALPGGMPIRANGTFQFKVGDYQMLIDKVAGVKKQYTTDEVRERVLSMLNQLLLRWIVREGKDMFNIQANAVEISQGILGELNTEMQKIGLAATSFQIDSVSYPEEVQKMVTKVASQSMVGDMGRYQQMAMIDAMTNTSNNGGGNNMATDMACNDPLSGVYVKGEDDPRILLNFNPVKITNQHAVNDGARSESVGYPVTQSVACSEVQLPRLLVDNEDVVFLFLYQRIG